MAVSIGSAIAWLGAGTAAAGAGTGAAVGLDAAAAAAVGTAGGTAVAGGGSILGAAGTAAATAAAGAGVTALLAPDAPKQKTGIPMPDEKAQEEARRRSIAEQMARRGRASTVLTDTGSGKLGG